MDYKQSIHAPGNYHQGRIHAVRSDDSPLCGKNPKYGWDPYEYKKEEVNCKQCQKHLRQIKKEI
jgi:hypothetical protein